MPDMAGSQGAQGGEGGAGPQPGPDTTPAIGDEFRWRTKATEAELRIAQLEAQVNELKSQLAQAEEKASAEEQRRQIEQAIAAADPLDLETVRLLIERAMSAGDGSANRGTKGDTKGGLKGGSKGGASPVGDAAAIVADLKRRKPFLFRRTAPAPSAMSPGSPGPVGITATDLADHARASGDRKALLQYLRARRGA